MNGTSPSDMVGWVPQDSTRSTLEILRTSLLTILLCTWTALHPRIHKPARFARIHKAMQFLKMVLAPELVCLEALQELLQAVQTRKWIKASTGQDLQLIQAFYLGMLGVRYWNDHGEKILWPGQYAFLLSNKIVSWDAHHSWGLDVATIQDKSKADAVVKLAALCQAVWFTLQCIIRGAQGLPIAPLETMTLAYVLIAIVVYLLWWKKPKDIAVPVIVDIPTLTNSQRSHFSDLELDTSFNISYWRRKAPISAAWYLVSRDCKGDSIDPTFVVTRFPDPLYPWNHPFRGLGVGRDKVGNDKIQKDASPRVRTPKEEGPTSKDDGETTDSESESVHPSALESLENAYNNPQVKRKQKGGDRRVIIGPDGFTTVVDKELSVWRSKSVAQWDPALYWSKWWPLITLLGTSFSAIHLISWRSQFPTAVELWLWRSCTVVSVVTAITTMQFNAISLRWQGPITLLQLGSPALYIVARLIITVQAFVSLREMPRSTYDAPLVLSYWFHLF